MEANPTFIKHQLQVHISYIQFLDPERSENQEFFHK